MYTQMLFLIAIEFYNRYFWKNEEVSSIPNGCTMPSFKRPLDGDASFLGEGFQPVLFVSILNGLAMKDRLVRLSRSDVTPGTAFDLEGNESRGAFLCLYDDDATAWDMVALSLDIYVVHRAFLRWGFDEILEVIPFWHLCSTWEHKLCLQSRVSAVECYRRDWIFGRARTSAQKLYHVVDLAVGTSLSGWTPENIDVVGKQHDLGTTVKHLNSHVLVACKEVYGQVSICCEICDAQDSSSQV